ncbi:MAG: flgG [Phycisphaerales bacterium]|nr:flgG [Phycisphaerales bacterium]
MRTGIASPALLALSVLTGFAGCAPRQDPGIPLPPPGSGAAALGLTDMAMAPQVDTVKAIDAAKRVVAFNLANAETTAFKEVRCRVRNAHAETYLNMEQGGMESTNRNLDVAINGPGFLRVKVSPNLGDGYAYTRNGNLLANRDGNLVLGMKDGYRLDPPISIPLSATDINISQDGVVQVLQAGSVAKTTVGQINLYQFSNPEGLNSLGSNLFQETDASGRAIEGKPLENNTGTLLQGFLEASNVDLTQQKLRTEFLDRWRAQAMHE